MKDFFVTGMTALGGITNAIRSVGTDSMIEYAAPARVEPFTIIENSLVGKPQTNIILQSVLSHYSGVYLQAFAFKSQVGVKLLRTLDSLSTERRVRTSVASTIGLAMESYNEAIPALDLRVDYEGTPVLAMEARQRDERDSARKNAYGKDTVKTLTENTNLSVGKLLHVSMSEGDNTEEVMVSVRLHTIPVSPDTMHAIMTHTSQNSSVSSRIELLRANQISLLEDFFLNIDLLREEKRLMLGDKGGAYNAVGKRERKNRMAGLLSGNPSVNVASAIAITTTETVKRMEREIGGRLSDEGSKIRRAVFENTNCMILSVYDQKWDEVTTYYRGIADGCTQEIKDIESQNKSGKDDITKVVESLVKGNAPSF